MKAARFASAVLAVALVCAPLAAQTPSTDAAAQPAGAYVLDTNHSSVIWSLSYQGIAAYTARFDKMQAELDFNPANPTASALSVSIDANSVNTGLASFDPKVAKEGLGAEKTPQITFSAKELKTTGENQGTMTGELTMNGVTKPATFAVTFNGATRNRAGKAMLGFTAETTIKRSEWGSNAWAPVIGDDVTITVQAVFSQKG
jgi:polyisoprenoid-binding protein YceI